MPAPSAPEQLGWGIAIVEDGVGAHAARATPLGGPACAEGRWKASRSCPPPAPPLCLSSAELEPCAMRVQLWALANGVGVVAPATLFRDTPSVCHGLRCAVLVHP